MLDLVRRASENAARFSVSTLYQEEMLCTHLGARCVPSPPFHWARFCFVKSALDEFFIRRGPQRPVSKECCARDRLTNAAMTLITVTVVLAMRSVVGAFRVHVCQTGSKCKQSSAAASIRPSWKTMAKKLYTI
jgi:hypothetical protein